MTVAREFYDWARSGLTPGASPYNKCAPALTAINKYLMDRYGGQSLGCFNVRDIKGTSVPSTHSWGAARDWRYADPGPGRRVAEQEILSFLIGHSKELGIQAIHDYVKSRIWRASWVSASSDGWRDVTPNPEKGMGASWATYFHIEVNRSQWADGRSVQDKIGAQPPAPHPVEPFRPAQGKFGDYPERKKSVLRIGATGDEVRYLQGVLDKARIQTTVDGRFERLTDRSVRRFQQRHGLTVDGVVGPKTWRDIDRLAIQWREDGE